MLVVALILWPVARRAISPASDAPNLPDSTDRGAGGIQEAGQPDEETLEALRSLGYISSGGRDPDTTGAQPEDAVADKESDLMPRGTTKTVLGRTASAPQPAPELQKKKEAGRSADRSADLSATSRLEPEKASGAETERRLDAVARQRVARPQEELKPALSEQDTEAAGESKSFQILSVGRAPELGRDHEVITATRTWSSLFEKSGEEPPVIDFTKQRAVLLHEALGSEPPARLSIETIAVQAGMLVITCRVERLEGSADATLAPGQIVLVPAGELPIRVVILP